MSRVGKLPVKLAAGVSVDIKNSIVEVKGKLGSLSIPYVDDVIIESKDDNLVVSPANDSKKSTALWGTFRSVLNNAVAGVSEGFKIRLEVKGVGYRTSIKGKILTLALGYSHDIKYLLPEGIDIKCETQTLLVVSGIDKQKVGQVSADIMKLRPFEPYKGKGIYKEGQPGRRKEGKKK